MNERSIYEDAVYTFGAPDQLDMLMEEMAELTIEINHYRRGREDNTDKVAEEIADVLIMLAQAVLITGTADKVLSIKQEKLRRLQQTIKDYKITHYMGD